MRSCFAINYHQPGETRRRRERERETNTLARRIFSEILQCGRAGKWIRFSQSAEIVFSSRHIPPPGRHDFRHSHPGPTLVSPLGGFRSHACPTVCVNIQKTHPSFGSLVAITKHIVDQEHRVDLSPSTNTYARAMSASIPSLDLPGRGLIGGDPSDAAVHKMPSSLTLGDEDEGDLA